MYRTQKCIIWLLAIMLTLSGCVHVVDSSMVFDIAQFEEFVSLSSFEEKENYISDGNLETAKIGNVYLVPFIKETTHDECSLFVYAYFRERPDSVCIDSAKLCASDGTIIYATESSSAEMEVSQLTDTLSKGVVLLGDFPKSEKWFQDGHTIRLSISYSIIVGEETLQETRIHTVNLRRLKSILMPT